MRPSSALVRKLALPLTRLHIPFVSAYASRSLERHLDEREVHCEVRGVRWHLDLNELIDHKIFYLGTHERFTTRRILESVPPNGVFFDVGANFGYFSLLVAHQLAGSGKVYAFEPMRRAVDKLQEHIALNGFRNIVLEKVVLGDSASGSVDIAFQNSWRLYDRAEQGREVETIPVTTLDSYVASHDIRRIDVMKIDVDGYELKVLSGASEVLSRLRPRIVIELGSYTLKSAGDSIEALVELLDRNHYRFYSEATMRRFGSTRELLSRVPENATINVVCQVD